MHRTLRRRSPWPQVCEQADQGPICHIGHGRSPQGLMSVGRWFLSHWLERSPSPSLHSTVLLDHPDPQLLEHSDHSPVTQEGTSKRLSVSEDEYESFFSLDLLNIVSFGMKKVYLILGGLASPAVASTWIVMASFSCLKLWILSRVVEEPLYFSTAPSTGISCSTVVTEKFPLRMNSPFSLFTAK